MELFKLLDGLGGITNIIILIVLLRVFGLKPQYIALFLKSPRQAIEKFLGSIGPPDDVSEKLKLISNDNHHELLERLDRLIERLNFLVSNIEDHEDKEIELIETSRREQGEKLATIIAKLNGDRR